jgi:hypothetical protein
VERQTPRFSRGSDEAGRDKKAGRAGSRLRGRRGGWPRRVEAVAGGEAAVGVVGCGWWLPGAAKRKPCRGAGKRPLRTQLLQAPKLSSTFAWGHARSRASKNAWSKRGRHGAIWTECLGGAQSTQMLMTKTSPRDLEFVRQIASTSKSGGHWCLLPSTRAAGARAFHASTWISSQEFDWLPLLLPRQGHLSFPALGDKSRSASSLPRRAVFGAQTRHLPAPPGDTRSQSSMDGIAGGGRHQKPVASRFARFVSCRR